MVKKRNNFSRNDRSRLKRSSKIKIFVFIIMVLVGLAAIFALIGSKTTDVLNGASLSGKLAAKVNSEEITMQELNDGYDRLAPEYKAILTKEDFLEQMIDQVLLLQEAEKKGLSASTAEAEMNIRSFMEESGTSHEELLALLNSTNLDYEGLLDVSRRQLTVDKLLKAEVYSLPNVSTEKALNYYNENVESFKIPEVLVLRHIFVGSILQNRTSIEADELAGKILKMVTANKSNFCDLVNEYSDDFASKAQCGEYQFPRGRLPVEFETWANKTKIDEVGIVSSEYGTHVIWLINKTPESLILFKDAQSEITQALAKQEQEDAYKSLVARIRKGADLKNYFAPENSSPEVINENKNIESAPSDKNEIENSNQENIAPVQEVKEEPIVEETQQGQTKVSVKSSDELVSCLSAKGAVLYGASWDSQTKQQLNLLGDSVSKIKYVECSVPNDFSKQSKECIDAKIEAYPTWNVAGKVFLGVYAPLQLAEAAGCE